MDGEIVRAAISPGIPRDNRHDGEEISQRKPESRLAILSRLDDN